MSEKTIGVVIIGRNEGERLKACLNSAIGSTRKVVYVDSGSTDGSVELARGLGADVVKLDISIPFTAARARNEGFQHLIEQFPGLEFLQFIDGDCEVSGNWFELAEAYLLEHPDVAVVCGRRRERYPQASVYNMLCDIEWNTPVGEARACGGDALMRTKAFEQVEGFNPALIAGEEPELCVRIRRHGWKIWRLGAEMTLHDANMTRFSQWWKRNVRSGYAFALGAHLHGSSPEQHWVSEVRRGRVWGLYIPLIILVAMSFNPLFAFMFAVYPLQVIRIALKNGITNANNWVYALYVTLGKFPELQGQARFYRNLLFKSRSGIIEYKS